METTTFLQGVLSDNGHYCVFAARSKDDIRIQKFYSTIEEVERAANKYDNDGLDALRSAALRCAPLRSATLRSVGDGGRRGETHGLKWISEGSGEREARPSPQCSLRASG